VLHVDIMVWERRSKGGSDSDSDGDDDYYYDASGQGGGGGSDDAAADLANDKDYSTSSSISHTTPPAAAPTSAPTSGYYEETSTLTILFSFSNGDVLVAMDTMTTRICTPAPLPSADTTLHRENDPSATKSIDMSKYGLPASTSASTTSKTTGYDASGWPESQDIHKTTPQTSSTLSGFGFAKPTSGSDQQSQPLNQDQPDKGPHIPIGAVVAIPLVVIVVAIILFFTWRKRRQNRRRRLGLTREMKQRGPEDGLPQYTADPLIPPPTIPAPPTISTSLTPSTTGGAPSTTAATAGSDPNQPVILNTNMGGAYLTGLDTSDALSIHSGQPNNRMSLDARSMVSSDDPPPPYRPRSVPPISRETSLRVSNGNTTTIPLSQLAPLSEHNLSRVRLDESSGLNNPFADPDSDDDNDFASESSTPLHSPPAGQEGGISRGGNSNPALMQRVV
jgi:hypothetical protein